MTAPAAPPLRFCFGIHLHQPVGNFDSVFEQHMDEVYLPFLRHAATAGFVPVSVHLSGPLLEWMESHDRRYLDLLGELAVAGRAELLLGGFYEPVLAVLPREDRLQQVLWMRDALRARFGVAARGLWLTERVWESELAADLHDAGVEFALVDDRHFLVSGFAREQLHAPYRTDAGGKALSLFPIDERLRYLIPFQPPEATVEYLRSLRAAGHRLAVLVDDAEKFGGWPGTRAWVYERGWLDRFFAAIGRAVADGEVALSTFGDALDAVPSGGLAYLGTASYREMEEWSLPPAAATRLRTLERELGDARMRGPDGALVRGSHWRNFLVRYSESNRLHKKMVALSNLCRAAGDPPEVRRAIGRAQCNDAYWHGVFGGLYLPHLRDALWRQLAIAEGRMRSGESLACEVVDLDGDGHPELWIHSAHFSAIVSPSRGGAVEEWTLFEAGVNVANTLTRRREAYHTVGAGPDEAAGDGAGPLAVAEASAPSIHELEASFVLAELPPADADDRALFVDRVLAPQATRESFLDATLAPRHSWATAPMTFDVGRDARGVRITLRSDAHALVKRLHFSPEGEITADWSWRAGGGGDGWFSTELSVASPVVIEDAAGAREWRYDIETVAKSERGLDRTRQGEAIVLAWPLAAGAARCQLRLAPVPAVPS